MHKTINLEKGQYHIIILLAIISLLSISMDSLFKVKDYLLFESWYSENIGNLGGYSLEEGFNTYLNINLFSMILRGLVPVGLSINTYLAYIKTGINKAYIYMWLILLSLNLIFILIEFNRTSIFFYISSIGHLLLILYILRLNAFFIIDKWEEVN